MKSYRLTVSVSVNEPDKLLAYARANAEKWGHKAGEAIDVETALTDAIIADGPEPCAGFGVEIEDVRVENVL
jgi:hypothetical protein